MADPEDRFEATALRTFPFSNPNFHLLFKIVSCDNHTNTILLRARETDVAAVHLERETVQNGFRIVTKQADKGNRRSKFS